MTATTPATAAATTGQQHNFSSGQTRLAHAPSGRTEPHPRRSRSGQPGVFVWQPVEGFQPDHRPDRPKMPHGLFQMSMIRGVRAVNDTFGCPRLHDAHSTILAGAAMVRGHRNHAQPSLTVGKRGGRAHWSVLGRNSDRSAEAGRLFVTIGCASRRSGSKDLEGDIEAHGRVGHWTSETAHDGTDPSTEQSLEADAHGGMRIERCKRQREPARSEQRREGTARGHRPW
jgi:hypothetical protein